MKKWTVQETEWTAANGEVVRLVYDETEDILEAFFGDNQPATGVELTDHILLRLNQATGRAVSLTLLHSPSWPSEPSMARAAIPWII
jgi:hypothetical protein